MEIFVVLIFVWAIVTVLGHLSWVAVRGFFRLITDSSPPPPTPSRSASDEFTAAHRALNRLVDHDRISQDEATELHQQLHRLQFRQTTVAADDSPATSDSPAIPAAPISPHEPLQVEQSVSAEEPVMAIIVDDSIDESASDGMAAWHAESAPEVKSAPVLSAAEVIRSFLAAHNIRWGELVAGMLIVVCSIGLVISLWNPLVNTHRVIPSLIFLAANAAIYAAGLYTLSRWRLRHTSRAVLVIATLLVPLSVLAGLAAAGTSADAVRLTDPITIGAIAVASIIYLGLLHRGGKALVRRPRAGTLALAVAGPVAVLPLIPASVRVLESNAGWMTAIGSLAVSAAVIWMIRLRGNLTRILGPAGGRSRLLVIGLSVFSLAVTIGYACFAVREFGITAQLPIAIAALPAVIAVAGAARWTASVARRDTQALVGTVVCVVMIGMSWVILPASMIGQSWVWAWALVLSTSAVATAWSLRQSPWLAFATLPLGMAATFSSPVWMGQSNWQDLEFWNHTFGGEPMIASALVAAILAGATALFRDLERRRWMGYAAVFWSAVTMFIAAGLAVGPSRALGAAPWWSVTCVLAAVTVVSIGLTRYHRLIAWVTVATTTLMWFSIFRPFQWGNPVDFSVASVWLETLIAIAATCLLLTEFVPRLMSSRSVDDAFDRAAKHWMDASVTASIAAAVMACFVAKGDWSVAAATFGAVSLLLFWASTTAGSIAILRASQVATLGTAVAIGWGRFSESLFGSAAWIDGTAVWAWAILMVVVAGLWYLIRWLSTLGTPLIAKRLEVLASREARPDQMPDGWASVFAISSVALAVAWSFASLLTHVISSSAMAYAPSLMLPVSAIVACSALVWAMTRFEANERFVRMLASTLAVVLVVWSSSQIAHLLPVDATAGLVIATSLSAVASLSLIGGLRRWEVSQLRGIETILMSVAAALVAVSSIVLLQSGWFEPISQGNLAHRFSTISVAAWWLIGAAGMLWMVKQTKQPSLSVMSACLAPASAAIMVPAVSITHPAMWVQVAAIAAVAWAALIAWWFRHERTDVSHLALAGSQWFAIGVGVLSAGLVTIGMLTGFREWRPVFGAPSFLISVLAVGLWCFGKQRSAKLVWPIGISILAGQLAWLATALGWVSGVEVVGLIAAILAAAAVASAVRYQASGDKDPMTTDFAHLALISVAVPILTWAVRSSTVLPWISLATLAVAGWTVAQVGGQRKSTTTRSRAARALGWWVAVAGGLMLLSRLAATSGGDLRWSLVIVWSAAWVVAWRLVRSLKSSSLSPVRAIPDTEFASLLMLAVVGEASVATVAGFDVYSSTLFSDPLFWIRTVAYVAVGLTSLSRGTSSLVWPTSVATLISVVATVAVHVAIDQQASLNERIMSAGVSTGFTVALFSHWLPQLAKWFAKREPELSRAEHLGRLVQSTWQAAAVIAGLFAVCSALMIANGAPAAVTQLTIVSIALAAWSFAVLAELSDGARLRHVAVSAALATIGLWASVDSAAVSHPILAASMRWLVASVFTIPMTLYVFPKLLGDSMGSRWAVPLRRGAIVAAIAACVSLLSMLGMEAAIRTDRGIDGISPSMVIGVAVTLAILSALAGLVAILSFERKVLSDRHRVLLVVAAQALGGITWLHVFLCKTNWAFVGLRGYWPYIVMGLAFSSVGVTEWARRRGDQVLARTLGQTAMYLPLLPVVGFWLSGSVADFDWAFQGGKVRYDVLLALGAIYYVALSAMWKSVIPRIGAIALGNAALWVVLVQQPGWGFLAHPQAWLIPPALCVLVVAHWYRERLQPAIASGIRYASTLVIYVSSTADMLLQEIGSNLAGPIVLVLLAMAGMLAGVVLRVRPFLYLGATFVFLGVTSMVWHAQRASDAMWPWWVFGITTGIGLLAALMAVEKNKPQLQRYAESLAKWE